MRIKDRTPAFGGVNSAGRDTYIKIIAMQRTFEKGAMELKGRRLPGEEVMLRLRVNGEEEVWLAD